MFKKMFTRQYVIEALHDNGGITKIFVIGTKDEIQKAKEHFKAKAYWYDEMKELMIIKVNGPV